MRYILRSPRPDELESLAEDLFHAYTETMLKIPLPEDEARAVADVTIRQAVRHAAQLEHIVVVVVEDTEQQQIAGATVFACLPQARLWYGLFIWVKDAYRGRGGLIMTRRLARHVEGLAKERGATRLEFAVPFASDRMRQIHELWGATTIGVLMSKRL